MASILQNLVRGGWTAANVVIVDPHGEYARALECSASVRGVLGSGAGALNVPFWALPADEILRAFVGAVGGTTKQRFAEFVAAARQNFVAECDWLDLDSAAITSDTPVPFDLHQVWYHLEHENNATHGKPADGSPIEIVALGDSQSLTPPQFRPYGSGSTPPFKGPYYGVHGKTPEQLRLGLRDPRLRFLHRDRASSDGPDPLATAVQEWLGGTEPISVLDFSGVPSHAADVAIGTVLRLLFELALRSVPGGLDGIGRSRPVLIVVEEAHRFLGDGAVATTREATDRIAREGRKYGVGMMLVSQRPSELPDTALSQCGTLIALRLTNSTDQGRIRATLPDTIEGLAAALPSLRTGEAIVSGEAIALPSRVLVDRPNPQPRSEDPSTEVWRREKVLPDLTAALREWRETYQDEGTEDNDA